MAREENTLEPSGKSTPVVASHRERVANSVLAWLVELRVHRQDRRRDDSRDDEPDDQEQADQQEQLPAEAGRGVLVHLPMLADDVAMRVARWAEAGAPGG